MQRSLATLAGAAARPVVRPLSPHLQVWKVTLPMYASGAFRVSGLVMFAGIAGLSIVNIPNTSTPFKEYVYKLQQYPLLNALVKFGVSFPLAYHLLGGLRHLAWDHAAGHSMQWNKQTAAAAFATAGVISAIAVFTEEPLPKAAKKA